MARRTSVVTLSVLATLVALPLLPLAGQDSPAPPSELVSDVRTSFAGFQWGATREAITAARGRPAVDTMTRDYRRLVYRDTVEAKPIEVWYLLHPTRGLMSGQLAVPKLAEKCQDEYKRVRQEVERANPRLKKSEEFKRNLHVVCDKGGGALLGSWLLAWGDSGSARIQQMMLTGSDHIVLLYRSAEADAYVAEQREKRGPVIDAFASFQWGVREDSIVKRLGKPRLIDSTGGVRTLSYVDLLLGERAIVEFTVSPVEGLIRGIYWVQVPEGRDCDVFFRKFHFALIERFIDLKPKVLRANTSGQPLCQALAAGTGAMEVVWYDSKTDASVTAEMKKPGRFVKLLYVGPPYMDWMKRTQQTDVRNKL